jgi:hypothetical protein
MSSKERLEYVWASSSLGDGDVLSYRGAYLTRQGYESPKCIVTRVCRKFDGCFEV